jgi:hypothetical protein
MYLGLCLVISTPIIQSLYNILYTTPVPAGMDVPRYIYYVLKIIKTKNHLISYSAFSDLNPVSVYYPSLFHIIIGALTVVTSIAGGGGGAISLTSVLNTLTPFVFAMYIVGIIGYAIVIKSIICTEIYNNRIRYNLKEPKYIIAYYGLLLLAFGLFIYSTSPMIKTFRDGAYGSIFCIWCLLPFYLYSLFNKRWIISALLLAVIASAHNLSFLMTLAVTIIYIGSLLLSREYSIKKLKVPIILFMILSLPAMIFFYLPLITEFLTGANTGIGSTGWWSNTNEIEILTPNLYYVGIISSLSNLFINGKRLWWLTGWAVLYFPLFSAPFMGAERFGRELCLPFGLIVSVFFAIVIYKLIFIKYADYAFRSKGRTDIFQNSSTNCNERKLIYHTDNKQVLSTVLILAIILPITYGHFDQFFKYNSYPVRAYWYSDAMAESNRYFLNLNHTRLDVREEGLNPTILVFGENPWLPATVYGKFNVLAVEGVEEKDPISALYGSKPDKYINTKLRAVLENPYSKEALLSIKQYNIYYIYISDLLPHRWYGISDWSDKRKLDRFQQYTYSPASNLNYINLKKIYLGGEGEYLRIYSIERNIVNNDLQKLDLQNENLIVR